MRSTSLSASHAPRVADRISVPVGGLFRSWITAMHSMGYRHRIISMNSMHAQGHGLPAPQSRDRVYVAFTRLGDTAPDFERMQRPKAYCPGCDMVVDSMLVGGCSADEGGDAASPSASATATATATTTATADAAADEKAEAEAAEAAKVAAEEAETAKQLALIEAADAKKAAEALRAAEHAATLAALDLTTDAGLCAADAELTSLELNDALAPLLGFAADSDLRTPDQDDAIRTHKNDAFTRACPARAS